MKRRLVTFIIAATALGAGLFGGHAAASWVATTTNPASAGVGSTHQSNATNGMTCTDTAGTCGTISASGLLPGGSQATNTTLTNTGTTAGQFTMTAGTYTPTPSASTICADLTLTVVVSGATVYSGALSGFTGTVNVGSPVGNGGSVIVVDTLGLPSNAPSADEGASCATQATFSL